MMPEHFDILSLVGMGGTGGALALVFWLVRHWQTKTFPTISKEHKEQLAILAQEQSKSITSIVDSFKGELMHQRNSRQAELERFLGELREERSIRRENDAAMQGVLRDLTKEIHSLPERLAVRSTASGEP